MFSPELKRKIPSICEFFETLISRHSLFHAYIFSGSNNSELKSLFVEELMQILNNNYINTKNKLINIIDSSDNNINTNNTSNTEENNSEQKREQIKLGQVQEFLRIIQIRSDFTRAFVIKKAEKNFLPKEPANALLKTIEEPLESKNIFFFFAENPDLILSTIKSRCQIIKFPSVIIQDNNIQDTSNIIFQELAQRIFRKKLSYFESCQIIKEFSVNYLDSLNYLQEFCLEKYKNTLQASWLSKLNLIDKYKNRIKNFCNQQNSLEELFYLLSR